jgi:hypothetical protein
LTIGLNFAPIRANQCVAFKKKATNWSPFPQIHTSVQGLVGESSSLSASTKMPAPINITARISNIVLLPPNLFSDFEGPPARFTLLEAPGFEASAAFPATGAKARVAAETAAIILLKRIVVLLLQNLDPNFHTHGLIIGTEWQVERNNGAWQCDQKKGGSNDRLSSNSLTEDQGLVGSSSSESNTMPKITAAAAAAAIRRPLPPPSLLSAFLAGAARFTALETGFAFDVAACAATGAAANANAAAVANRVLPKRINNLP